MVNETLINGTSQDIITTLLTHPEVVAVHQIFGMINSFALLVAFFGFDRIVNANNKWLIIFLIILGGVAYNSYVNSLMQPVDDMIFFIGVLSLSVVIYLVKREMQ